MTSITDIPFDDIKDFLLQNDIKIPINKEKAYNIAKDLIINNKAKYYPDSIIDWIIAYNFSQSAIEIPVYTLTEINTMSQEELDDLATILQSDNNSKESIINILSYLHKLQSFHLLSDEIKFAELLPKLGLEAFLSFCATDIKHYNLYNNDIFWKYLYERDYSNEKLNDQSYKDNYILAYQLDKLIKNLGLSFFDLGIKVDFNKVPIKIGIKNLYNLKGFKFDNKNLTLLPKEIGILVNLKRLDLSRNELQTLPKEIGQLKSLEELIITNNKLKELPNEIGNLLNLIVLGLESNNLISLPIEIGKLNNLEFLDISNNQIIELPDTIGGLINLREFFLNNNKITYFPKTMLKLVELRYVKYDHRKVNNKDITNSLRNIIDHNKEKDYEIYGSEEEY